MPKTKQSVPSNFQLHTQLKDTNLKIDKLVDVVSKMTEGVGTQQAVEPKIIVNKPAMSGVPQKYRDAVDKVLGKDFGLVLENNDDTLSIIVPDRYSYYKTPGTIAATKSHHNTERVEYENLLTRNNPNMTDEVMEAKMTEWDAKHPIPDPIDRRPLAFTLAVIGNQFEEYCQVVKRNIEKELDIKL